MTPRRNKNDPLLDNDFNDGEEDEDGSRLVRFARLSWDLNQLNSKLDATLSEVRDAKRVAETTRDETRLQFNALGDKFATKKELEEVDNRNKPVRDALAKINWIVITAVILAILGLIITTRGGLP